MENSKTKRKIKRKSKEGRPNYLVIVGIFLVFISLFFTTARKAYKKMQEYDAEIHLKWDEIEKVYDERNILITNLIYLIESHTTKENKLLSELIDSRIKLEKEKVEPVKLNSEAIHRFQDIQSRISGLLLKMMTIIEKYPEMKDNPRYIEFLYNLNKAQDQIVIESEKFNQLVKSYNFFITKFPRNIYSNFFYFDEIASLTLETNTTEQKPIK